MLVIVGELMSIGEFASRCGLSAKMLRSYAAAGLLVPAAVDASSGYRYYSTAQLDKARIVGLVRRAGIGIQEIAGFFDGPDPGQLDGWDQEIIDAAESRQEALAEAKASLSWIPALVHFAERQPKGVLVPGSYMAGSAGHDGGRASNEDAVLINDGLWAVADGIGGLHSGATASRLALESLESTFRAKPTATGLLDACRQANQAVWRKSMGTSPDSLMGTTLTALAVRVRPWCRLRSRGRFSYLPASEGPSDPALARPHRRGRPPRQPGNRSRGSQQSPHRHVLTRAVGVGPQIEVEFAVAPCTPGDRLLLCTDGLTNALSIEDLEDVLGAEVDPQASADALVSQAARMGADDNVTALVLNVL